jgi:hypothetical protein
LDDLEIESRQGKKFFLSLDRPDWLWGSPALLLFNGHWGSFLGVERLGREFHHTPM